MIQLNNIKKKNKNPPFHFREYGVSYTTERKI